LLALAVAGLVAGLWHAATYMQRRRGSLPRHTIDTWEGEGGAVPLGPTQTAAQVAPRQQPQTSTPSSSQFH
jgi:hypothetical protein